MSDSARQFRVAAALVGFAIPVVACNGAIGDHPSTTGTGGTGMIVGPAVLGGKSPEEVLASCAAPSPGRSPLRRLSNAEYRNTIADLFANVPAVVALIPAATSGFPSEPESLGFRNSGDYLTVPSLAAQNVPRRRRADRRDGGQRQQLRDLRERHAGRRLRDQLHQFVRQAGLPPAARRRRHGPLSGALPESDLQRLRLQDGHRVDRLRDVAVAAVPLPVRARRDAHGQLRQAHAIRDRVPPLLHLPAEHAGRGAARGRRQRRAGDAGADRGASAAPAGRSQGRAPPRLLRAVARHRHAARHRARRDGLPEPRSDAAGAARRARRAPSPPICSRRRRAPSTRSSPRRTRSPTRRSPSTTASPGRPGRRTRRSTPRGARAC